MENTNDNARFRRKLNQHVNIVLDTAFALSDRHQTLKALKQVQRDVALAI